MDQFASMMGKENKALKIDTRSLGFEYSNIDLANFRFVLCDTKISHSLASSQYNTRREECQKGVKILQKYNQKLTLLREVSLEFLEAHKSQFEPTIYNRCEFVVSENLRVLQATKALKQGNLHELGKLIYQSHEGLSSKYEVGCEKLDFFIISSRIHASVNEPFIFWRGCINLFF